MCLLLSVILPMRVPASAAVLMQARLKVSELESESVLVLASMSLRVINCRWQY